VTTVASPGTRADDVYTAVRADLLAAQFRPGQWMKVSDLQRRFGFSISVIREALNRLTAQGLLQSSAQRGFRVAELSIADLQDLTDARIKIETLLLRESLRFGTDAWEADVLAAHHLLSRLPPRGPDGKLNTALIPIHAEFHERLLAGCPNAHLRAVANSLRDKAELYRMWSPVVDRPMKAIAAEHRKLMELALARKEEECAALLASHIDHTRKALVDGPHM
jgi:DNA-binding GntR family transcriptional regulator